MKKSIIKKDDNNNQNNEKYTNPILSFPDDDHGTACGGEHR